MPISPSAMNQPDFPNEDELEDAILSTVDAPVPPTVVDRFKNELKAEGEKLQSDLTKALKAKENVLTNIARLRAQIAENERAQKALVKRTRSK